MTNSPVSNDGCGLKRMSGCRRAGGRPNSPVSNDGCGLKRRRVHLPPVEHHNSPVSNDGCGLKHSERCAKAAQAAIHPSAMTGAISDGPRKVETSVRARLAPMCRSRPGSIVPVGDTRPSIESSCRPSPWSFTWRMGTAARWASPQPCGRCPGPSISNPTPGAATGWHNTAKRIRPDGYWRGSKREIYRGAASGRGTFSERAVSGLPITSA